MKITRTDLQMFQPEVRQWSLRRKMLRPWAGLAGPKRDSAGGLILVSRHWPHLLCWSWVMRWHRKCATANGRWFGYQRRNSGGWLALGRLVFEWQSYDSMVASRYVAEVTAHVQHCIAQRSAPKRG